MSTLYRIRAGVTAQKQELVHKIEKQIRQERWRLLKFTPLVNHVWVMYTLVSDQQMYCPFINSFVSHTPGM